jgi:hypothetical protein
MATLYKVEFLYEPPEIKEFLPVEKFTYDLRKESARHTGMVEATQQQAEYNAKEQD